MPRRKTIAYPNMWNQLIVVIGLLICSCPIGEAQTSAKPVFPGQLLSTAMPLPSLPSAPSYQSSAVFPTIPVRFTVSATTTPQTAPFSVVTDRTPFVSAWSVPVAQFGRGHLQLEGFVSNWRRSPQFASLGPPSSSDQESLTRTDQLYGLRLRLSFGQALMTHPIAVWRSICGFWGSAQVTHDARPRFAWR